MREREERRIKGGGRKKGRYQDTLEKFLGVEGLELWSANLGTGGEEGGEGEGEREGEEEEGESGGEVLLVGRL